MAVAAVASQGLAAGGAASSWRRPSSFTSAAFPGKNFVTPTPTLVKAPVKGSRTCPNGFLNGVLIFQRCGAGSNERGFHQAGALLKVALPQRKIQWRCAATTEGTKVGGKSQMLVYVPPHPLIKHWVSVLRNEFSPPLMFRSAMAELGRVLIYEASRDWLLTVSGEVNTPCGVAEVEFIDPREPVKVVPILRAGLVLVEQAGTVLPANQTFHLGFVRNEETLEPSMYLNKLPEKFEEGARVLVADPMLATGGTIVAALEEITKRGADVSLIRVVAAVAAPPALKLLSEKFPGLRVYVGIIDEALNEKGYIVPGLGDAGDRSFGTE